jgi:hypothetical protein
MLISKEKPIPNDRETQLPYLLGVPTDVPEQDADSVAAIGSAAQSIELPPDLGNLADMSPDLLQVYRQTMASRSDGGCTPGTQSIPGRGMMCSRDEIIHPEIPPACKPESPIDCCDPSMGKTYIRHTLLDAITRSKPMSQYEIVTVAPLSTQEILRFNVPQGFFAFVTMILFELWDTDYQTINFQLLVDDAVPQFAPKIQPDVAWWTWVPLKEYHWFSLRAVNLCNCTRTVKGRADGFIQIPRCFGE